MNEFEAWQNLLNECHKIQRVKRLNQELYNMLGDSLFYLLRYAEKNNIALPNKDALMAMVDRIHGLMNTIDAPTTPNNHEKHPDSEQNQNLPQKGTNQSEQPKTPR